MFFRFAPMGKVEKTRFERNWTTFVNPAFSAAWKSPPKMVAWNRNCKIRSQGCFSDSPRWGKLKKRVLNAIERPSSIRLFPLLGKAHPKWWHETEIVKFDPKGVFPFRPDGESWKNAFWTQLDDLRQSGFFRCLEKPTQNAWQNAKFSTFPIPRVFFRFGKTPDGIEFYNFGFMPPFWVRAFPSSGKSRIDEGRPIAFKTRFFNFPHRGETEKHPWDRILQFRFHATILGGLFQAAENAGLTKVVQLRSKRVFSTFPIGAKRWKTPLGSNFTISVSCHHFGWAFPSTGKCRIDEGRPIAFKTRFFNFPHRGETKKHPWDRILQFRFHATILGRLGKAAEKAGMTKVVQLRSKRVFSTFPIGAKRWKTPLGSNFTISVSCHHFGWAFPSTGKSRIDEGRSIAFKTRFFNFPHRGETEKHPWDRILQFRFHATILGGLFQAAEKAGLKRRSSNSFKTRFFNFPHRGETLKNTLGIEFYNFVSCHHFGWAFPSSGKCRMKRRSSNCVQNAFFQLSPSGRNVEKHPWDRILQFRFMPPFWVGFGKQRKKPDETEGRPIAFQTRFFNFPHRGETKKHPWDRILQFRFMPPFWVGFSKQRKKPDETEGRPIAFKTRFFNFPHRGETLKNTLGIEFYNFGFMPPFWVGFSKQRKKPALTKVVQLRSKRVFSTFPIGAKRKNTSWDRILQFRFHATILAGLFQAAEKCRIDEGRSIAFKTRFFNFPHRGETLKNTLGIEFYNFGFMPPFWVGFSKQRKKPDWRRSSNCVQNAFFQLSPSGRNVEKHPWDRILQFRFMPPFWVGLEKQRKKPDETKVVQLRSKRVFSTFPIGAKRWKTPLGSNFTISVSCHHFGWAFPSSGKTRIDRRSSNCVQNAFFQLSPSGRKLKKHPWDRILQFRFHATILGRLFQAAEKAGIDEGRPIAFKTRFFNFPHRGETKKHPWDRILQFRFMPPFWVGFSKPSPKWWHETEGCKIAIPRVFFRLRPDRGETLKNTRFERNWTTFVSMPAFSGGLGKAQPKMVALKPKVVKLRSQTCFFNFRPDRGESWKNASWERNWTTFGFNAGFFRWAWKSPRKNGGIETEGCKIAIPTGVFQRFAPIGAKRWKTRVFNAIGRPSASMPAFSAGLGKAQRKMVAWNRRL